MKLTPLGSKVVLQPLEKEKVTQSGLVIPDTANTERPMQGTVVAVGPGGLNEQGGRIDPSVAVGDMVLFKKYGPDEVEVDGATYLIADESDILAVITQ
jgi:chaperonin GroES